MTILQDGHKSWPFYSKLEKCGELTTSADGRFFGLNCIYCTTIFTRLDEFTDHIKSEHVSAIELLYAEQLEIKEECSREKDASNPEVTLHIETYEEEQLEEEDVENLNTEPDLSDRFKNEIVEILEEEDDPFKDIIENETLPQEPLEILIMENREITHSNIGLLDGKSDMEVIADSLDNSNDDDLSKIDLTSIENRDVLSDIIAFYEKHPGLWDVNYVDYNDLREKYKLLNKLVVNIKAKFDIQLNPELVRDYFRNLLKLYRKEFSSNGDNMLQSYDEVATNSKLWCFDNLKFLRTSFNKTPKPLSNQQILEMCKIYKNYPVLWNLELGDSRKLAVRKMAFEDFVRTTSLKLELDLTHPLARTSLRRIKQTYSTDKLSRLECEINGSYFMPKYAKLYDTLQYIDDYIAPFRCEQCDKVINNFDKYRSHLAAHQGRNAFDCKVCGKDFPTVAKTELHMITHTRKRPFKCSFCDKAYPAARDLAVHERSVHTKEKPFVCHVCGQSFSAGSLLNRHLTVHNPETRRYQCPHCTKKFCLVAKLKDHINSHLQLRAHVCGECGKGFFALKTLREHQRLHSNVLKYSCDICGKKFKQFAARYAHLKTHKKIRAKI